MNQTRARQRERRCSSPPQKMLRRFFKLGSFPVDICCVSCTRVLRRWCRPLPFSLSVSLGSIMSQAEGDKAVADAEKKLKGNMFGLGKDPDAAVDCFKRACNNYKVAACCTILLTQSASLQQQIFVVSCLVHHVLRGASGSGNPSLQR